MELDDVSGEASPALAAEGDRWDARHAPSSLDGETYGTRGATQRCAHGEFFRADSSGPTYDLSYAPLNVGAIRNAMWWIDEASIRCQKMTTKEEG